MLAKANASASDEEHCEVLFVGFCARLAAP
jgi:hypothetical protein